MGDRAPASQPKTRLAVPKAVRDLLGADGTLHPALIPGIGISDNNRKFGVDWWIFGSSAAVIVILVTLGLLNPEALGDVSLAAVHWVSTNTGWLFSTLTVTVFVFMMIVGYSSKGRIRLGTDNEKPEFSRLSWITMLFAAGMGIGLIFYGPFEPLHFFLNTPPAFSSQPGTAEAMQTAIAQTMLHWGPLAWSYYALVGGAIAYSAFRRGRSPVISALFDPIFSEKLRIPFGRVIDIFAILVTLFGTAVSLGLGALQIGRGIEIVGGIGQVGNAVIIGIIVLLTIAFILSAVSGIKRGIRALSNLNMLLALGLGVFVFIAGPTLFLLNFIPSAAVSFVSELGSMLTTTSFSGPDAGDFMEQWTTYYWAWWVSWTPFVGMFIAKISRGRTLREFVTVVILVPSSVCLLWFGTMGGTSMWMESEGLNISGAEASQDILFRLFDNLPWPTVMSAVAMVTIFIFFITSADSASLVMASTSERGRPVPSRTITITWGIALSATAVTLLLAGGSDALGALQALVTVSALPFAIILILLMVAWWKDLSTDPLVLRQEYANVAIDQGVRLGIQIHGDGFVFSSGAVQADHGAGAWLDTEDPALTEWFETALSETATADQADAPSASVANLP